jgi:hypothetical protein
LLLHFDIGIFDDFNVAHLTKKDISALDTKYRSSTCSAPDPSISVCINKAAAVESVQTMRDLPGCPHEELCRVRRVAAILFHDPAVKGAPSDRHNVYSITTDSKLDEIKGTNLLFQISN